MCATGEAHAMTLFSVNWRFNNVGKKEHRYLYVYYRLKYLIIINILIQSLFSSLCRKEKGLENEFVHLCSMYRYYFYEFYVFCALVSPFTIFIRVDRETYPLR